MICRYDKTLKTTDMNKQYQKINELVIAGLKSKGLKWFRPWKNSAGQIQIPVNNATGRPYKGFNVFLLNAVQQGMGYTHNEWITYKQAQNKGGQVQKGEKSTAVFMWKISFYDVNADPKKFYRTEQEALNAGIERKHIRKAFSLRQWNVFNISQCEGIEPRNPVTIEEPVEVDPSTACENAQATIDAWADCPEIRTIGNQACYNPIADIVKMPKIESFVDCDSYYKTLFHELAHSTGHKDRLNRDLTGGMSSDSYAKEELVAEIASIYLSEIHGLDPKDSLSNSQAYVNGWVSKIENAKGNEEGFVVSAMGQAMKAVEMIHSNAEEAVEA